MGQSTDTSAYVAAGAQMASTSASIIANSSINEKTREWNEKMADRSRQWAKDDWNMQNEYNSPTAQMARLKAAGLNPNLIYGKGAGDMTSGAVRSSDTPQWNPKPGNYEGFGQSIMAFIDIKFKEQQMENMRTQMALLNQDQTLKNLMIDRTAWDNQFKKDHNIGPSGTSSDYLASQIKGAEIKNSIAENELQVLEAIKPQSIQKAAEIILNMRMERTKDQTQVNLMKQQIENLKQDNRLKKFDEDLRKQGIMPGTPWYVKAITSFLDKNNLLAIPEKLGLGGVIGSDKVFPVK